MVVHHVRPILKWENPVNSGITLGVGNLVMLCFWLISLVDLIFVWLPFVLLATGGGLKAKAMTDKKPLDYQSLPLWVPTKMMEVFVQKLNCGIKAALPVIFWDDIPMSLAAFAAWYVATTILDWFGLFLLCFLVFNGAFVYGKFEKEILTVAGPHIAVAKQKLAMVMAKIPKYSPPSAPAKKSDPVQEAPSTPEPESATQEGADDDEDEE